MNNTLLKQIELFVSFLKRLTYDELVDLEKGNMKLEFVKRYNESVNAYFDSFTFGQYVKEIESKATREECVAYLEMAKLQRRDLENILKYLGVTFTKKDNKAKLQSKIIENTIGRKLRDDAIINK